jgi:homoserine dehydrogenase
MKQVNIAILGFGTVGTGVARLLLDNGDILRDRIGCELKLKVCGRYRHGNGPGTQFTSRGDDP